MPVLNFADFTRRKAPSTPAHQQTAVAQTIVTDRWATLHTTAPEPVAPERDFLSDLQLRMAYPTYPFRQH